MTESESELLVAEEEAPDLLNASEEDPAGVAENAGSCNPWAELAVRKCSAPRAEHTCVAARPVVGDNATCIWTELCMRCVPPEGSLNVTLCQVDSTYFYDPPRCPQPVDNSICTNCGGIELQEVCLGLCADNCVWANVSWMRGRHCSLRVPPVEVEDQTLLYVLASIGGAIFLAVCGLGCRAGLQMRRQAKEDAAVRRLQKMQQMQNRRSQGGRNSSTQNRLTAEEFVEGRRRTSEREDGKKRSSRRTSTRSADSADSGSSSHSDDSSKGRKEKRRSSTRSSERRDSTKESGNSRNSRRSSSHSTTSSGGVQGTAAARIAARQRASKA